MKKITLLLSGLILLSAGMFAQKHVNVKTNNGFPNPEGKRCSSTQAMKKLRDQNPAMFDARKIQKEQELQNWIANNYDASAKKAVITIPVVVQIWKSALAVPDSRVTEQLQRLNDDFRRTNSDAGNTPGVFSAADCEIEFCLTSIDPQGNPTTGIIRKTVNGSPDSFGGPDLWDTDKYLNIFVYDIGGGTLGFTYLSSQAPNNAVHIGTSYFGNTGGQYGMGRTASHEVGHWLNLEHIWGDANCGDDFVSDTPTQQSDNFGCPNHPSASCGNNGDMFMNYMDYVNDNCMNAFTQGQKTRMIAAINNHRPGLLNSAQTACGNVLPPPPAGPCDSTVADWDWNNETYSAATWGADCNGTATSGYMMGSNCYDDYQWASKVSFSLPGKELTDIMYTFVQSTGSGATNLKVWNADGAGQNDAGNAVTTAPGTILYSTATTSGAYASNLNQLISVPISPAVALTGDFYIGYDHPTSPAAGDTLAMGTSNGTSGNTVWANEGAGIGWRDIEYWGSGAGTAGTALNLKGTVVAVVCDVATGEKEILGNISQLSIYPNPSNGTLNVALVEKVNTTVLVYNMLGELVYNLTKNTQLFTVDLNNQPNGVYFVKVKNGNEITTKKVILSK